MRPVVLLLLFILVGGLAGAAVQTDPEPRGFGDLDLSPPLVKITRYQLQEGDTVTSVAKEAGLTVETVLSYNRVSSPRFLRAGRTLELPSRDGVRIHLDVPTPVQDLAVNYQVFPSLIRLANRVDENARFVTGDIFLPGAKVDPAELRKQLGAYFAWPTIGGRISSYFGRRNDPFTGARTSHSGVDIANPWGTPVLAAGDGVVTFTGFNPILGNHIMIDQGNGYVSVYGHLSAITTQVGRKVKTGQRIGRIGSTGYSTGPHLHFSAYRWNRLLNPMTLFG